MFQNLTLQLHAFRADLLETCRDDDGALHPELHGFFNNAWHSWGWGDDDDQVHHLRHGAQVGVGFDAEDAGALRVDGVDRPAKGVADQIPEDGPSHAARRFGRTDDGNAFRRKDSIQRLASVMEHVMRGVQSRSDTNIHRFTFLFVHHTFFTKTRHHRDHKFTL